MFGCRFEIAQVAPTQHVNMVARQAPFRFNPTTRHQKKSLLIDLSDKSETTFAGKTKIARDKALTGPVA